jgi:hypothetical protein
MDPSCARAPRGPHGAQSRGASRQDRSAAPRCGSIRGTSRTRGRARIRVRYKTLDPIISASLMTRPPVRCNGSDRSVDAGPGKENKPCSPLCRFLRNGFGLLTFSYRQGFPAQAFASLSYCRARQGHGTEVSVQVADPHNRLLSRLGGLLLDRRLAGLRPPDPARPRVFSDGSLHEHRPFAGLKEMRYSAQFKTL